jgi:hypothetical protein
METNADVAARIEQLKAYLKKPSKGVSPDKPWFDEAILDGVGGLVDVTLRRHMLPLGKGFEFPKVFKSIAVLAPFLNIRL